jgi:ribonuclease-3
VIELIVSDYLYHKFPDASEGILTTMRATIVRAQTLAHAARVLDLGKLLFIGKGESQATGRTARRLLAQAYEAVVGAIYLDQGMDPTRAFVLKGLGPDLDQVQSEYLWMDPKSRLQELTQATAGMAPAYEILSATGPGHRPHFAVQVRLGVTVLGSGEGESKQDAEEAAARVALRSYKPPPRASTA